MRHNFVQILILHSILGKSAAVSLSVCCQTRLKSFDIIKRAWRKIKRAWRKTEALCNIFIFRAILYMESRIVPAIALANL